MYDVLIVGAGPAGAALAILLAEQGARVLLLEKERFPRYKACGGGIDGLAARRLAALGVALDAVQLDAPTTLCVTKGGRHPTIYRFVQPLAITAMRADLDAAIARRAVAAGATWHEAEPVRQVRAESQGVVAVTSAGRYEGRLLVGADGANGVVARSFGLNRNPIRYVLLAAEVEPDSATLAAWAGRSQIDLSVWPLGYSWVFPKRDHLSIGSGVPWRCASDLRHYFAQFCQRANLAGARTLVQRGHPLDFRRGPAALALDRVLLVGDAAGLVDPATGGGIGPALRSAELAAQTLLAHLSGEVDTLRGYTSLVDREISREFRLARILRNSIVLRFLLLGSRATGHRSLWHDAVRVVQGEEHYTNWYARSRLAPWLAWTNALPL